MSYVATTWAWQQEVCSPMRKLILLHMADAASEENGFNTWYSLAKISERCNCSRGSVRNHIKSLVQMGYLTMTRESTRVNPAKYRLNVGTVSVQMGPGSGGATDTHLPNQVVQEVHHGGTRDVPQVVQEVYEGGTTVVPKPVIEPVSKPVREIRGAQAPSAKKQKTVFILPEWMPEDLWSAYLESRAAMKKHPMNPAALDSVVVAILKVRENGYTVAEALEAMTANGWRSVKSDWLDNYFGKRQGSEPETVEQRAERLATEMQATGAMIGHEVRS